MNQLKHVTAAISIHPPVPVGSKLAAVWLCLEIKGRPLSSWRCAVQRRLAAGWFCLEIKRQPSSSLALRGTKQAGRELLLPRNQCIIFPNRQSFIKHYFQEVLPACVRTRAPASILLSLSLDSTGVNALRSHEFTPQEETPRVCVPTLSRKRRREGRCLGSPPGKTNRSRVQRFGFPRHLSPGYLIVFIPVPSRAYARDPGL